MNNSNNFSSILQNLRKENKITQEQLATTLGVSAQAVSKWENGSFPEGDMLPRIADFFKVSIDYLYGRDTGSKSIEQLVLEELQRKVSDDQQATDWCTHKSFQDEVLNLIWAIQISGWINNKHYYPRQVSVEEGIRSGSVVFDNLSYSYVGLNPNEEFYLFLKEPEDGKGFSGWIRNKAHVRKLFALLTDEDNIRILEYLYSMTGGEYVSLETIVKKLRIDKKKVQELLDTLLKLNPRKTSACPIKKVGIVNSEGGKDTAYGVDMNLAGLLMGMFALAENYTNSPDGYSLQIGSRDKSWIRGANIKP